MARFTTLYSGSSGNSGIIEDGGKFLMVDIGRNCKTTLAAMDKIGLNPENLSGIMITHEHTDHISGLRVFLKKYPVRIYSSHATLGALWNMGLVPETAELIAVDGRSENIEGFEVTGFPTSHDSAGCCGFRIKTPSGPEMAIATDLGVMTEEIYSQFAGVSLVALESNYDHLKLFRGPYPNYLKQRIASHRGHLCNDDCAKTVARLVNDGCRKVALCHLSEENNHPELVRTSIEKALFESGTTLPENCVLQISRRHQPSDWMDF